MPAHGMLMHIMAAERAAHAMLTNDSPFLEIKFEEVTMKMKL